MRLFFAMCAAVLLQACAYPITLHPREAGGEVGNGFANSGDKSIEVKLAGKVYRGTYTVDEGQFITTQSFGTATAYGRGATASGFASGFSTGYAPGSGNGRALATAGPGDTVRCEFTYRDVSGIGVCQDNAGKLWDLVIGAPGGK